MLQVQPALDLRQAGAQVGAASPVAWGVVPQPRTQPRQQEVLQRQVAHPWVAHLLQHCLEAAVAGALLLLLLLEEALTAAAVAAVGAAQQLGVVLQQAAGTRVVRVLQCCCHWPQPVCSRQEQPHIIVSSLA